MTSALTKVVSPTGRVHIVESSDSDGVVTLCHHHYGTMYSTDISVDWPSTNEQVTCKRCLIRLAEEEPVKKIIHVNQHVIKHNLKYDSDLPPCRVQQGSKSRYCREVDIKGPSKMVYHPDDPLSCGARLWIETNSYVELIDEVAYDDIRVAMEEDRNEH